MSAAELRQAAETLRGRAAVATEGPWMESPEEHQDHGGADTYWHITDDREKEYVGNVDRAADAAYIAIVHPGVGLALADWLDEAAERREGAEALLGTTAFVTSHDVRPITLARHINGGAA